MIVLVFLFGVIIGLIAPREFVKMRRQYCVQFRLKGTRDDWSIINYSVGSHRRAREVLKMMLHDWTYRQYEYRVATRKISDWTNGREVSRARANHDGKNVKEVLS